MGQELGNREERQVREPTEGTQVGNLAPRPAFQVCSLLDYENSRCYLCLPVQLAYEALAHQLADEKTLCEEWR